MTGVQIGSPNEFNCRLCDIGLTNDNWYPSLKRTKNCICKSCANKRQKDNVAKNPLKYCTTAAAYRADIKNQVFSAYGNKCDCCGEDNLDYLAVDHIHNDGGRHRKSLGISAGSAFYKWIVDNDFPSFLRLLCHNCNSSLGHLNYCPHKSSDNKVIVKCAIAPTIGSKICRECNVELTKRNAYPHHLKSGKNICKSCWAIIEHYRVKKIKEIVMGNYGGKCVSCGETHLEFLTIDHINNDGATHRKEVGWGVRFYRWLIKNNFPQGDFQALCYNCNSYKEYKVTRKIIG